MCSKLVWDFPRLCGLDTLIKFIIIIITSKVIASVSTDVIVATAGWTEESTFRKFYNKPVALTNQMSLSVLE